MLQFKELSDRLVPAFHRVHRALGPGLLESAYEGALAIELAHLGIPFTRQQEFPVIYRNQIAGSYFADMVVDQKIVLELKSVNKLSSVMEAQLLNYLGISGLSVGYLLNFRNQLLEKKRFVL
ncbi:MAG: GxxExxY protein [Spirochaetaceae bacterium]|jgi:GxxExxY protein|nr:GxxExxY protein [Spirochaetaceae bacterium]